MSRAGAAARADLPVHARYDLLAIDLDGTLLDPDGRVSPANIDAVHAARAAGIQTVVCTGRGLLESRRILTDIAHDDPVVLVGGAMIACPQSGRTLHRFAMDRELVHEVVGHVVDAGHAALIFKDPAEAGFDYLVVSKTGEAGIDPVTRWWFDELKVRVRIIPSLDHDEHPEHTVRVGLCAWEHHAQDPLAALAAARMREHFSHRTLMHHFPAVVPNPVEGAPNLRALILELFDARVSKWTAIRWLADSRGIPSQRIAAIGDQINDEAMIRHAGLGIAMGNAIPEIQALAQRKTRDNSRDGVAWAIERILHGEW